jgi:mono/diheme cytochrome c family protein
MNTHRFNRRVRRRHIAVAAGVGMAVWLAGAGAAPFSDETMRDARRDYRRYCASCHGDEGRGDGPVAQATKAMPADLTLLSKNNDGTFPYQKVRDVIDGRADVAAHGPRTMPVWGKELYVSPEGVGQRQAQDRIDALTEYVQRMQRER